MFRSKKKKVSGRKRREVELESGSIDVSASADGFSILSTEIPATNASQTAENDLHVLQQQRRNRSRSVKSVMTFHSKSMRIQSSGSNNKDTTGTSLKTEETGLLLSFDDDVEGKKTKKTRKIRPNLVASSVENVEIETMSHGLYSIEMLAALRSEQSVLLASKTDVINVEGENDKTRKKIVEEQEHKEEEQEEREEEFISLGREGKKQSVCMKNRVTFGVYSEGPSIFKKTEVVEEMSDREDEEDEHSRKWEEELMRRGGHRVPQPLEPNVSGARDGLPTYPIRRNMKPVSLESVLGKLEKSVESTSFENERASRELARLESETASIDTALKQQQEDLLVSSERFEYFGEMEDFVKSLSFCLRAKVPVITAIEEKIVQDRARRVKDRQHEEQHGVVQEVKYYLVSGKLQLDNIFGLDELDLHVSEDDTALLSRQNFDHAFRTQKYQQHFTDSYMADPHHAQEDLFADAIDEINSLERVYGRFQEWKAKFPEVYKDVYCELAQEKLFAPYVQAEMLYWDPLGAADAQTEQGESWSLDQLAWFRVLHQHLPQLTNEGQNGGNIDGPILYQIRNVLIKKVHAAISSYFDPYSGLQTRSLSLVLEQVCQPRYFAHVEEAVQVLVSEALEAFLSETKRTVLVAIDQNEAASGDDVHLFARYLLERFTTLQDNLLTLFVTLSKGTIAASGFRCLLLVLQHLFAYVRVCHESHKTQLLAMATQVVRQLYSSSYLLQHLAEPSQKRELMHVLDQFRPFLQTTSNQQN
ncbi:unnamed protein product [Peronospora belbahrii]|uniref:GCF C-terminal domain-containing protein n=1 Tax=Peronospora belbahrii TaxID=622444 RepID=A0AAU9KXN0_9STRA|nr:unnamed protein product [Peronospora belbahrii]